MPGRAGALKRDADTLAIGPSSLRWDGTALTIDIEEVTAPIPSRLSGRLRVLPDAPFHSRSEIRTRLLGQDATAVHE